jgi:FAD/FMN-containing dehydrogenase
LWRIRHSISESVQACGRLVAFDLAVSRSRFAEFREAAVRVVQDMVPSARICDFGHLGDGGIQLNLVVPNDLDAATIELLRETVYDLAVFRFDGSYSAEHGVGPYNASCYERFTSPLTREVARVLKMSLDPGRGLGNAQLS